VVSDSFFFILYIKEKIYHKTIYSSKDQYTDTKEKIFVLNASNFDLQKKNNFARCGICLSEVVSELLALNILKGGT
jgi:hypothetical protein